MQRVAVLLSCLAQAAALAAGVRGGAAPPPSAMIAGGGIGSLPCQKRPARFPLLKCAAQTCLRRAAPVSLGQLAIRPVCCVGQAIARPASNAGGLFTALTLRNEGYDVSIFEKTTEYRAFGGPIQIASNGLEAVRRIDRGVYDRILEEATCLGARVHNADAQTRRACARGSSPRAPTHGLWVNPSLA